jgi:GMP reductase
MTALDKFISIEALQRFALEHAKALQSSFISLGVSDSDFKKFDEILQLMPASLICLDVANGYTERFVESLEQLREKYPLSIIMAGNVVTGEMVEELILSGADIVKIGIGPGSVCTTREKTGVGYPQLSAIIECADAAHGLGGHVCADGGCTTPGDVAKAFAAGADFVMLGGMLAGHDECLGEVIEEEGKKFKRFYGMSSSEAMERHHGMMPDYRASEGRSVNIPYRGPVKNTILDILGGIRSACTYVGAHRLKELSKRTTFIRVTRQLNEIFTAYDIDRHP